VKNVKKYLGKVNFGRFNIDEDGFACFGDNIKISVRACDYVFFTVKGVNRFEMHSKKNELDFHKTMAAFLLRYVLIYEMGQIVKGETTDG